MEKLSINAGFSIATFDYQRVFKPWGLNGNISPAFTNQHITVIYGDWDITDGCSAVHGKTIRFFQNVDCDL